MNQDSQFGLIFGNLESACGSLRGVAKVLGLGAVEIVATDPKDLGILGKAADSLARSGVRLRQALVGDPELDQDPRLVLIGGKKIPGSVVPELLNIPGFARVSVS